MGGRRWTAFGGLTHDTHHTAASGRRGVCVCVCRVGLVRRMWIFERSGESRTTMTTMTM
jgi:hypothetical protein